MKLFSFYLLSILYNAHTLIRPVERLLFSKQNMKQPIVKISLRANDAKAARKMGKFVVEVHWHSFARGRKFNESSENIKSSFFLLRLELFVGVCNCKWWKTVKRRALLSQFHWHCRVICGVSYCSLWDFTLFLILANWKLKRILDKSQKLLKALTWEKLEFWVKTNIILTASSYGFVYF